ncbi:MAG: NAD-binding protein [Gammaproteobacteria bacterium]|nr:NAD-binding protein [Gammaproteobacteria bacterium]
MPQVSQLDRVASIVLRLMRRPLLTLVAVYAVSIVGMVLMPGIDAEGNPGHMSFFHAFYFMTYTATTTGFGELPVTFSNAQRMWAIAALYMSVVAWFYAIGSIIRLVQNPHFRRAVAERAFTRSVRRITEPFFIVCGFGDTGSLLTRGLSDSGYTAVVVDDDGERIKALSLRDYRVTMPGLQADASVPRHLLNAGLRSPLCRAIVALTPDEDANVKIAVMARLLNPEVRVICLATSLEQSDYLRALPEIETVNPFAVFARYLSRALSSPKVYALTEWLIQAHGASLDRTLLVPRGDWILAGHGRMGRCLSEAMRRHGVTTIAIDPAIDEEEAVPGETIAGRADARALEEAGIERAVGIVAATNNDADNLGVLLNAHAINPDLFMIVRQNDHENELAFAAAEADLIMQPSLVTARKILFMLISPLIDEVLHYLDDEGGGKIDDLLQRLHALVGTRNPRLWTVHLDSDEAPAALEAIARGRTLRIEDLVRSRWETGETLPCLVLAHRRGDRVDAVPSTEKILYEGDELLLCGTTQAIHLLGATLANSYRLDYLITGYDPPRGYLGRWLQARRAR